MSEFSQFTPSLLFIIKIGTILFMFLYIIFAGIVIKQVRVMTETLQVGLEKTVKLLAVVHFAFALTVFILSIFVL